MSLLGLEKDAINTAMIDGLRSAFKKELKQILIKTADEQIEAIVDEISYNAEIAMKEMPRFDGGHFQLEWLIKHVDH